MKPTQLIVNDVLFPTTTHDQYRCYPMELKEQLTMIAGNIVEELRGTVQMIEASYDAMSDAKYKEVLAALRSKSPLYVAYLPDDGSTELVTSTFLVQSFTPPSLSFFDGGVPKWHNLAFVLREECPHDRDI